VFVTTTAEETGVIMTEGNRSTGLFAQSVGGGGGNGGFAISGAISDGPSANFALGGNGGTGANSDTVFVNSSTSIATRATTRTASSRRALAAVADPAASLWRPASRRKAP
jgi:hypothetical protein